MFYLPADECEKITLCISVLLSLGKEIRLLGTRTLLLVSRFPVGYCRYNSTDGIGRPYAWHLHLIHYDLELFINCADHCR